MAVAILFVGTFSHCCATLTPNLRPVYNPRARHNAKAGYLRQLVNATARLAKKGLPTREWDQFQRQYNSWIANHTQTPLPYHLEQFQELFTPNPADSDRTIFHNDAGHVVQKESPLEPVQHALEHVRLGSPPPSYRTDNTEPDDALLTNALIDAIHPAVDDALGTILCLHLLSLSFQTGISHVSLQPLSQALSVQTEAHCSLLSKPRTTCPLFMVCLAIFFKMGYTDIEPCLRCCCPGKVDTPAGAGHQVWRP